VVPLAVPILVVAMLLQAAGEAAQKRGLDRRAPGPWLLGAGIAAVSVLAAIQAIAGLDVSVATTLSTTKILFSALIAVALLGERLGRTESIALACIFCGALVLALDARESGDFALERHLTFGATGAAALAAVALSWLPRFTRRLGRELPRAVAAGLLFGAVNVIVKVSTELLEGSDGSFNVLRPGSLAELARVPELWLLLFTWATGVALLQVALASGRYAVVGPLVTVTISLLGALLGVSLFAETIGALRALGIAVVVAGAAALAWASSRAATQARATRSSPVTPPLASS
jgi:drug/metabolite transporter (DMT)-like permease